MNHQTRGPRSGLGSEMGSKANAVWRPHEKFSARDHLTEASA